MMGKDLDVLMKIEQEKLKFLKIQLERVRQRLVEASSRFIRSWYRETAKVYVAEASELTKNLGERKLRQMKSKVDHLVKTADIIAKDELFDERLWWPLNGARISRRQDDTFTAKQAIRFALGRMGSVLQEYGYLKIPVKNHYWSGRDYSAKADARLYCPYMIKFPKNINDIIDDYNKLFDETTKVVQAMHGLLEKKRKEETENLWDLF